MFLNIDCRKEKINFFTKFWEFYTFYQEWGFKKVVPHLCWTALFIESSLESFCISLIRDQTYPMLWVLLRDTCGNHMRCIGRNPIGSCTMCMVLYIMGSTMQQEHNWISQDLQTQTRKEMEMIGNPPRVLYSWLDLGQFVGPSRSKQKLHSLQ